MIQAKSPDIVPAPLATARGTVTLRQRALRGLLGHKVALVGLGFLVLMILSMLLAPILAPHDPLAQDVTRRLRPPFWESGGSFENILGTDQFGRDILSRLIHGARVSLAIGFGCTIVTSVVGVALGMIAGLRPRIGDVIMRIADAQIAFPYLVLAIAIVAVTGPGIQNLVLILSIFGWVQFARLVRADVMAVKEKEYVEAARAIGASDLRIALQHVLPNVLSPVIVVWTFMLAQIIIVESSLSFLGFGVPPPTPSWGSMLSDGRVYLDTAWWLGTFPGLAIMLTVLSVNLLGDALRDILDPRFRP
ncbi:MAG: ABC transporter permease [Chloroflexota bacterium]|nr:MAG: ABC transporter permease [Chloroflexota bacterium]